MTRVKICGITRLEDALAAAEAGADFLGFIFYPPSPRSVPPERAAFIIQRVRQASTAPRTVGVFVDREVSTVARIAEQCKLDGVQLHGDEPPEAVERLLAEGLLVFKAFRVRDAGAVAAMERYPASAHLLDAYVPGQPGGTGETFDWALAGAARRQGRILLAGGLTSENVARAVARVQPWGVDTASGVETAPGQKDHERVRRFVAAARQAARESALRAAEEEGFEHEG